MATEEKLQLDRINNNVQAALRTIADTGVSVAANANSDALPAAAAALANEKQDKLTGTAGQVVGFDANGNAVAQEAPSGGGGGVQPDWNQTDESAADFIKNRPFGDGLVEIMPETEIVGEYMDGDYGVMLDPALFPGGISELTVIFDGVKYSCVADLAFGFAIFGNVALIGGDDTGEPFCIAPEYGMLGVADGNPHSISISGKATIKLPDKYYDAANYCFTSMNANDPYIYTDYTLTTKMTWEQLNAFGNDKPVIVKCSNGIVESKAIAWTAMEVFTAIGEAGSILILKGGEPTPLYTAEHQP